MQSIWQSYIPFHVTKTLAQHPDGRLVGQVQRFQAVALFADVSGFTAISEKLGAVGRTGSEELTEILNRYFKPMIELLHRYGGIVGKFGGDAMTVLFPFTDETFAEVSRQAVQCAWEMQAKMADYAAIETSAGVFSLEMKVGIAAGPILSTIVGDPAVRLEYVLAGKALDQCADAEHHAERGEIVVCEEVAEAVAAYADLNDRGEFFRLVQWLKPVTAVPLPDLGALSDSALDTIAAFMHPSIAERLRRDQVSFINEHRPVTILFISFAGFDYDHDAEAAAKLQAYFSQVIQIIHRYDGFLNKIDMGDKGSKFIVLFGAPISHEDDEDRALRCALDIRALERPVRVGVNSGFVYCGHVGSDERREYTVMGDAVNLAARLMQAAGTNQILVSAATQTAVPATFVWEKQPPLHVKGKQEPVHTFRLGSLRQTTGIHFQEPEYALPMVGRRQELTAVAEAVQKVKLETGQIVGITAEAGMGKSRFAAEAIKLANEQGLDGFGGECLSHGTKTSYLVWQNLLRGLLGVAADAPPSAQIADLQMRLTAIDPELVSRLPLLSLPLNIPIPDNELTTQMDAKLRKASLESLVVDVLRYEAGQRPLLLVLEDCHWIDPLSNDLLTVVSRGIRDLPVLILVVYRPLDASQVQLGVTRMAHFSLIDLQEFSAGEAEQLIALKLQTFLGETAVIPPELVQRITERAGGNPFYIDEMVNLLHDRGIDPADLTSLAEIELPDSLQNLILSRLDQLEEEAKTTVKVASVIGRLFRAGWLWHIYPKLGTPERVRAQLEMLDRLDIALVEPGEEEAAYFFKHILTRDVAYESLAVRTRAMLHEGVGNYIETHYAGSLDRFLDLLAYHFDNSPNKEKKRHYFRLAAQASQKAFANEAAIDYFSRLLPLIAGHEQAEALLELGQVYLLVGRWAEAEETYHRALAVGQEIDTPALVADCQYQIGVLMRHQGKFEEALKWLELAKTAYEQAQKARQMSDVYREIGAVYWSYGRYEDALTLHTKSKDISEAANEPRSHYRALNNIGGVYWSQGKPDEALSTYLEGYHLAEQQGDKLIISVLMGNIGLIYLEQGDYLEALNWFTKNLNLAIELGYQQGINIAIGNIGIIYFHELKRLKDAEQIFALNLRTALDLGDRFGVSLAVWVFAEILSANNRQKDAAELIERAIYLGRTLGLTYELCDYLRCGADVYRELGQIEKAVALAEQAQPLAEDEEQQLMVSLTAVRVQHAQTGDLQTAVTHLHQLLAQFPEAKAQAAIYYDIWRLSAHEDASAGTAAADLYRQLYQETPNLEYKYRYENITGEPLGQPSELPPLPASIRNHTIKLTGLLPQVDALIQEIKLEAEAGVEETA